MQLAHVRRGSGPTLVLVHGIGSQWQAWEPVIDRVAGERDVLALDLPGFGGSPELPTGITPTVANLAAAVGDFLRGLGVQRPHVAGNSLGGWVALELARAGRVASATLLSPGGFWSELERRYATALLRATAWLGRRLAPAAPAALRSPIGRSLLLAHVLAHPARMPPAAAVEAASAFAHAPGLDATLAAVSAPGGGFRGGREIGCPVTIAWGSRDLLLPPWQARRAAAVVPHARRVTLAGCGHVPMWDDPDLVARVLLEGSCARDG